MLCSTITVRRSLCRARVRVRHLDACMYDNMMQTLQDCVLIFICRPTRLHHVNIVEQRVIKWVKDSIWADYGLCYGCAVKPLLKTWMCLELLISLCMMSVSYSSNTLMRSLFFTTYTLVTFHSFYFPHPSFCIVLSESSLAWCLSACPSLSWRTRWRRFPHRWHTGARCPGDKMPAWRRGECCGWESPPGTSCSGCSRCLCTGLWRHRHRLIFIAVHTVCTAQCVTVYVGKYLH